MRWCLASFRLLPSTGGVVLAEMGGNSLVGTCGKTPCQMGQPCVPGKKQTLLLLAASLYYSSLSLIRHNIGVKIEQKKIPQRVNML